MTADTTKVLVSVVICTHKPDMGRLARTLQGLCRQELNHASWECLIVDNASGNSFPRAYVAHCGLDNLRVVVEPKLGLTHARRRGCREAEGEFLIFVDDDNVLAPDYLEKTVACFEAHPDVGALGGRSLPDFESEPPPWLPEFHPLLALRDLGEAPLLSMKGRAPLTEYPACAPIGAGMAVRREALASWLDKAGGEDLPDRQGSKLSSAGDNDLVAHVLEQGWQVAYFPQLSLQHIIPKSRLSPEYLARLNEGIQESWIAMLASHGLQPWPGCSPFGARLRILRAWVRQRPWVSPVHRIRHAGTRGIFRARSKL